ncbi:MAG: glycosyltransferase family 4 protein [Verrucomicrobiota bacterium]|nr:glycosyltransferase family 4 protein [Verrucomicrobiota bacterium]
MKIIIHDYAGHPFQAQLSRALVSLRGHEVIHAYGSGLVTPQGNLERQSGDSENLLFAPIPLHKNYAKNKYNFLKRRGYEISYGKKLAKLINRENPDVVMSGNMPSEPQRYIQSYCRERGIRFINWIQDFYGIAVDKVVRKKIPILGPLIGSYFKNIDKMVSCSCDANIVITEDFREIFKQQGLYLDNVHTVPNWANLDEIKVTPKANIWATRYELHDKFVFLYSGTLAMKHNPALLVNLAKHFSNHGDVRVVVASEGPGREWLGKEKIEKKIDNLILLPFQPYAVMSLMLGAADVLVGILEEYAGVFSVPSKILTYMCAQRPQLAAMPQQNLATKSIVENNAGLVVGPSEMELFVKSAKKLYNNAVLRNEMGRNARTYAEANFDIELICNKFENILTDSET